MKTTYLIIAQASLIFTGATVYAGAYQGFPSDRSSRRTDITEQEVFEAIEELDNKHQGDENYELIKDYLKYKKLKNEDFLELHKLLEIKELSLADMHTEKARSLSYQYTSNYSGAGFGTYFFYLVTTGCFIGGGIMMGKNQKELGYGIMVPGALIGLITTLFQGPSTIRIDALRVESTRKRIRELRALLTRLQKQQQQLSPYYLRPYPTAHEPHLGY